MKIARSPPPPECKQTASHAISTRRILRQQTRNRIVRLTKVRSLKRERERQKERSGRFRCATSQYLGRYNRLIDGKSGRGGAPSPYLTAAALAFHERDMRTGPDIWTPVERITEANGAGGGKEEKGREGCWARGETWSSYRLGEEHEISITRLPFHQTRGLFPRPRSWQERRRQTLLDGQRRVISNERRNGTDLVHNPRRGLLLLSSLGTRSIFEGSANVNLSTFSASLGIDVTNRWQLRRSVRNFLKGSFQSVFLTFLSFRSDRDKRRKKSAKKLEIFRLSDYLEISILIRRMVHGNDKIFFFPIFQVGGTIWKLVSVPSKFHSIESPDGIRRRRRRRMQNSSYCLSRVI